MRRFLVRLGFLPPGSPSSQEIRDTCRYWKTMRQFERLMDDELQAVPQELVTGATYLAVKMHQRLRQGEP